MKKSPSSTSAPGGGGIVWLAYLPNLKVPENSNEADDIQGNGTAAGATVSFLQILLKTIVVASLLLLCFHSLYKWNKFADTCFNMTGVWMSVPPISILQDTAPTLWRIPAIPKHPNTWLSTFFRDSVGSMEHFFLECSRFCKMGWGCSKSWVNKNKAEKASSQC